MKIHSLFTTDLRRPLVVTPAFNNDSSTLQEYLTAHSSKLQESMLDHGGILFRGFELKSAEDFRRCTESLGAKSFAYVGGDSPRSRVAQDVYTSTDHPPSESITLHNEMSYLPSWPKRLFFFSLLPAASGGQTSLADSGEVLETIPSSIVDKFRKKGVRYIRHFYSGIKFGKSWQTTYQTEDRATVERIAAEQNSTCEWLPRDILRVSTRCPATMIHPHTGKEYWFNQAEQWHPTALDPDTRSFFEEMVGVGHLPHECEYGDGEPLEPESLDAIRQAANSCKLLFDWQRSDFLMIDNILMMHGREPFKGERKTLAYLSAD